MGIKPTNAEFIEKANIVHSCKYDYSLIDYKRNNTKIKIICSKHGIFEQTPHSHLLGFGCFKCSVRYVDINSFKKKANNIHGNKYDYSNVIYVDDKSKISINCLKHGVFEQSPNNHLSGSGCPTCAKENKFNNTKRFIYRSNKIHGNKYDYSLVNYVNNKTKVSIICNKHGIFEQKPNDHLSGIGCPRCNQSKGEFIVENFLRKNNIKYNYQHYFTNCKRIRKLFFDFYLPEQNTCIEYDGKQHYEPNKYFGGIEYFEKCKERDKIKNNFCKENNINLIRIKYNENIEEKLNLLILILV